MTVLTLEELTVRYHELRDAVFAIRHELGEPGDGRKVRPIHPRLEAVEAFVKRSTA